MEDFSHTNDTQKELTDRQERDQAIVECLRIFARRGRQLRERQVLSETTPSDEIKSSPPKEADLQYELMPHEQAMRDIYAKYVDLHSKMYQVYSPKLVLPQIS